MEELIVPEIGESVTSGFLAAWLKQDGEQVTPGEEVFELETDKATLAVPSPTAGVLHVKVEEGEEVTVGQVVALVDGAATGIRTASSGTSAHEPSAEPAPPTDEPSLSPAVRRVVEEYGLDPRTIVGTGSKGRITKADAIKAAQVSGGSSGKQRRPPAADSGAARVRADEGTATNPAAPNPARPRTPSGPTSTSASTDSRQRREPMSNLRRKIAENLVLSRQSSAHVTTFNEVDMSRVIAIRKEHQERFQDRYGVRLGFMSFFVKASQTALEAYPEVNAYLDGTDIVYNGFVNIGVALSSEKGLLTPVLKDVATMSFGDVESRIVDFITRAGEKRLMPDEMTGATFTISNGGVFGSLMSTPIPSPPQTAVLGMHAIKTRPVVVDTEIVARPMMYLALTYDHRMVDGREAVGFLGKTKDLVENPTAMLLGL
jgi:2-oxoglutarate dehydrogenase E2 component (dihydrolipoamide succinyltransferase)